VTSRVSHPAQRVPELVQAAQAAGWKVGLAVISQMTKLVDVNASQDCGKVAALI
jgi:hypothetical protein